MARHLLLPGFIFSLLLIAACTGHQSSTVPSPAAAPAVTTAPAVPPAPSGEAALLAHRTNQYAAELEAALRNPPSNPVPSAVQFVEPNKSPAPADEPSHADASTRPEPKTSIAASAQPAGFSPRHRDDGPFLAPEGIDSPESAPSQAAPSPLGASSDLLEKKLQQQVRDYPRDLAGQLDYQLLRLVRGETTPDLATISGLSAEDRQIVAALMDGLNNFRNTVRADNNMLLSRKILPLMEMSDRLASYAELSIPAIALCSEVRGYGIYTPIASAGFPAGRENRVIVYTEVGNFSSQQNDAKRWEIHLRQEMVLYTETGMKVWPQKSNALAFNDESRNHRHDLFLTSRLDLPANLTIGRYLLKVTITDDATHRVAEASTPINIVAQ